MYGFVYQVRRPFVDPGSREFDGAGDLWQRGIMDVVIASRSSCNSVIGGRDRRMR
jgi:hypothetical protein